MLLVKKLKSLYDSIMNLTKKIKTLKNTEIAKEYNVSKPTVTRWVDLSEDGKYNLQLDKSGKKVSVIDNEHNRLLLGELSKNAINYKTEENLKKAVVDSKLYDILNYEELIEVINDLRYSNLVKEKYFYKNAKLWNKFYKANMSAFSSISKDLVSNSIQDIVYQLPTNQVNVIDIGIGTGDPAIHLISELQKADTIVKQYVGIDLSTEMLDIAKNNLDQAFPNLYKKFYKADIEKNRLGTFFTEKIGLQESSPSIITLFGGTICNIEDRIAVFKHISSPMKKSDIFIVEFTLDSDENKMETKYMQNDSFKYDGGWPLEVMGIDVLNSDVIVEYNSSGFKDKYFLMDKDYQVQFSHKNIDINLELRKGDRISVWRHYLFSINTLIKELNVAKMKLIGLKLDNTGKRAMAFCKRIQNL